MEDVHGKACSVVTCGARSVAKASESVAAAEVVCHAPNKTSFFEQLGGCQRLSETGVRSSTSASAAETVL